MTGGVRVTDPETAHAAAAVVDTASLEWLVVNALVGLGGRGTSEEVASRAGVDLQSITPRFRPLVRRGKVKDSGEKRKGKSGRRRIVWEIVL